MISKEEFAKIVKEMQASGKPVTVRNLMVQTELPRATVEQWLEDLQGNADLVPKAQPKKAPVEEDAPRKKLKEKTRGEDDDSIFSQVNALKDQVVGDVVKSQLGIKEKTDEQEDANKKSIATGAILGLLFPPAAFAYAAPILEGLLGGVIYFAFAFISYYIDKIPGLGRMITTPLFLALHLVGAAAGLAYAFRYNRNGKRMALLPKGGKKSDDE